jgi:hypothetical protein
MHGLDACGVQQQKGSQQAGAAGKRDQQRHLQARVAIGVQAAHESRDLPTAGEQARAPVGLVLRYGFGGHA